MFIENMFYENNPPRQTASATPLNEGNFASLCAALGELPNH
jgi:hypothetical protein